VTASGKPYVLWITQRGTSWIRIKYRSGSSWVSDNPAQNIYSHAPAIYAQNNDIYAFPGHDDQIRFGYDYHLSGQAWAPYTPVDLADRRHARRLGVDPLGSRLATTTQA